MTDPARSIPWRQGHVIPDEFAAALGLVDAAQFGQQFAVVVSHDCDLANSIEKEPLVEVIVGSRIEKIGADGHAKTARRLQIEFQSDAEPLVLELLAIGKIPIPKDKFLDLAPEPNHSFHLDGSGLETLQRWLAARYRRAAFADEFETRLKANPARLHRKLEKRLDGAGKRVLAVFFEVDDVSEVSRQGPDDVYDLRITLLYDGAENEAEAYAAAQKAADAIEADFEAAYRNDGSWKWIRLAGCDAVSDQVLTGFCSSGVGRCPRAPSSSPAMSMASFRRPASPITESANATAASIICNARNPAWPVSGRQTRWCRWLMRNDAVWCPHCQNAVIAEH